jgi:hypothetical protein
MGRISRSQATFYVAASSYRLRILGADLMRISSWRSSLYNSSPIVETGTLATADVVDTST